MKPIILLFATLFYADLFSQGGYYEIDTTNSIGWTWVVPPEVVKAKTDSVYGILVHLVDFYNGDVLLGKSLRADSCVRVDSIASYYTVVDCDCGYCLALCYGWMDKVIASHYYVDAYDVPKKLIIKFIND